ncbi:MAG: CsgG/HfaB family protein [Endomicrobiia bacterium]
MKRVSIKPKILLGIMMFVGNICFAAVDQNIMIDNAIENLPAMLSNISSGRTVAILNFQYDDKVTIKNVEEKVALQLSRTGKFVIVDRSTLDVLLKEQAMTMSGIVDTKKSMEIGKVIGVDTFLSGKVMMSNNKVVINLQMKDVKTSGMVWMGELVGRDISKGKFAGGVRVSNFIASARTIIKDGGVVVVGDATKETLQPIFGAAFLFHYAKPSKLSSRILFGIDAMFTRGDWVREQFDGIALGGKIYSIREKITDYNLNLMPILKYKVIPKSEIFMIYGGAGLSADYIGLEATYVYDGAETKHDEIKLYPAGGIAFKIGLESMVSDNVSFFFETTRLPVTFIKRDIGTSFRNELTLEEGSYYGFGVRYFLGK